MKLFLMEIFYGCFGVTYKCLTNPKSQRILFFFSGKFIHLGLNSSLHVV